MEENITSIVHHDRHGRVLNERYFSVPLTDDEGDSNALAMSQKGVTEIAEKLRNNISQAGKVDDVRIDGQTIVDENKVANIDSSQFGKVDDVRVNGSSVVNEKIASISMPTKVSQLDNDADYATKEEAQGYAEAAQITSVEVSIDDNIGEPWVDRTFEDGELDLAFHNLKGEKGESVVGPKGDKGDSAIFDPQGETVDVILANTLGNSTVKGMTQKAITEAVIAGWGEIEVGNIIEGACINGNSVVEALSIGAAYFRVYKYFASESCTIRISASGLDALKSDISHSRVALFSSEPVVGDTADEVVANETNETFDFIVAVPANTWVAYSCRRKSPGTFDVTFRKGQTATEATTAESEKRIASDADLQEQIDDLADEIIDANSITISIPLPDRSTIGTADIPKAGRMVESTDPWTWAGTSAYQAGWQTDIKKYAGGKIRITPHIDTGKVRYAFLSQPYDKNLIGMSVGFCAETGLNAITEATVVDIPSDASVFWCYSKDTAGHSSLPDKVEVFESITDAVEKMRAKTYHVDAVNGNDDNDGLSASKPFKTLAHAFDVSGQDVSVILHGDTTENLISKDKRYVQIVAPAGQKARIICGTAITDENAEAYTEEVDEETVTYDGMYVAEVGDFPLPNRTEMSPDKDYYLPEWTLYETVGDTEYYNKGIWLYQHDLLEEATRISKEEEHPCQARRAHRLTSTRMHVVANVDAVKVATEPVYYYDYTNHVLYFRIAEGTSLSEYPVYIRRPDHDSYFDIFCERLNMVGIEILYCSAHIITQDARITECANNFGDNGWRWQMPSDAAEDRNVGGRGVVFIRCEAGGTFASNGNGDGFGAGMGSATLIDCWAHDNNDDGYSEHGGSQTTIIGGLYEYNGKGGIVPSKNDRITVYGAVCRKSRGNGTARGYGICVTGTNTLDGKPTENGTKVYADGVLCTDNPVNFHIDNSTNVLVLINCISLRSGYAGFEAASGTYMMLHNCYHSSEQGQVKAAEGTIVVQNAELVV